VRRPGARRVHEPAAHWCIDQCRNLMRGRVDFLLDDNYHLNNNATGKPQIMRKSKVETAETRQRIVEVAAREFRANGIQATGVADLMSEAGLSHGGFYRHFDSKDQLVAKACEAGLTTMIGELEEAANGSEGKDGFRAIVEAYVSSTHRDEPEHGCPLAGLGSELARADEQARSAASRGFDELVEMLAKRIGRRQREAARSEAVFALSAMIGAITMSRIITDPDASLSILQDVRRHLEAI